MSNLEWQFGEIPFHQRYEAPLLTKRLLDEVIEMRGRKDGVFNSRVRKYISDCTGALDVFLTPSCTAALEMAFLLIDLEPQDEVIVPAFNFTSGCLPIVNHGAVPVFVDVRKEDFCLDAELVAEACTDKTKAILWTNYGGAIPDIHKLRNLAIEKDLVLVEDNAHGFGIKIDELALGSLGHLSTHSFHETKNVQCGEGGSLQINTKKYLERSAYISEKGTNRELFLQGGIERYEWIDKGGSFLLAEPLAAILFSQILEFDKIQEMRRNLYKFYEVELGNWAVQNAFELPAFSKYRQEAAHLFYLIAPSNEVRNNFTQYLQSQGISSFFHYQDLSNSPAGTKWGRTNGRLCNTKIAANRLVRLPMWPMPMEYANYVVQAILRYKCKK